MRQRTWYYTGHRLFLGAALVFAALAVHHLYDWQFWVWVFSAVGAFVVADAVCYPRRYAKLPLRATILPAAGGGDDGSAERSLLKLEAEERASRFARDVERKITLFPAGDTKREEKVQWPDDVRDVAHVLASGDADMALIRLIAFRHVEKYPARRVPPCA
jgi:hypothetical protein